MKRMLDAVIVDAGFAGLSMLYRLRGLGFCDEVAAKGDEGFTCERV